MMKTKSEYLAQERFDRNRVQYSTVQCSAVLYSAVQCSAVQYSTEQCSAVQYSTRRKEARRRAAFPRNVLSCTI